MNIKIGITWKIFILQILLFLFIINSVTGGNESVRGDINYNIELFGVKTIELQAPEVYINQTFWARATIRVNQSYSAGVFNATIILPSGFTLPDNDQNHSNPVLAGFSSEWITNWTVKGPPTESNYTINVTVLLFDSTLDENITVNAEPADWENGSVIVDAGGPYNFSDTGGVYATVRDKNGNYTNIIAECNTTIYYPNASVFEGNRTLSYLTGSHGQYYYNFTVPSVTGNYTANASCTLPEASNTSTFEVVTTNRAPYFTNIFAITGSYIHRSDNNPVPTQDVDFWVYVTDPDGDPLTVIISYSTDGKQSFSTKPMPNVSETGPWVTQIGNFVAKTTAYYYVIVSDGSLTNRTPAGYDSLIWDFPSSQPGGGVTGGAITPPPEEVGKGKIDIIEYPVNISVEQGGIEFAVIKIKNTGNDTLHNVFITLEGIDLGWYSIDPTKTDIGTGETKSFIIKFIVPLDAVIKQYPVNIRIDSDEAVERVQVIFEVTSKLPELLVRIVDIEVPKLEPDKAGIIKIFIENHGTEDKIVSLVLTIPYGWLIDEAEQIKTIPAGNPAGEQVIFEFKVVPNKEGIFILKLKGNYENKEFSEDIPVNVQVSPQVIYEWFLYALLIVIIILTIVIITIYRKHKRMKRREFIELLKRNLPVISHRTYKIIKKAKKIKRVGRRKIRRKREY